MGTSVTEAIGERLSRLAEADLRLALLIRHFELKLLELFSQGQLHGTTHTCLGQEYVPVALCPLLQAEDFVFSNHRGHGHYLARYQDPRGLLAEIMGRQGAVCDGVGGSQHILRGRYLSTGVQGQSLPVAVGVGLSLRRSAPGKLVCVFMGDGTWGEGAVYEALNMAALWEVPLLLVVEHNGIAQSTPTWIQMAGTIAARAAAFQIDHHHIESIDINLIRNELAPLVQRVRDTNRPLVVEFATYRIGPHSKGDDCRSANEIAEVLRHDWYRRYAELHPEQFTPLDTATRALIAQVAEEVAAAGPSVWNNR